MELELPSDVSGPSSREGSGSFKTDPGEAFRRLSPADQQLACVCALFGAPRTELLIENLTPQKIPGLREAIRALVALDRPHRLKIFARSLGPQAKDVRQCDRIPPRLVAILALANPGREAFVHADAARLLDEAKRAHPALRTYAVRSRTFR
jgi:hypothetical protein